MYSWNTMSDPTPHSLPDYPEDTEGSRVAREAREAANNLTDEERAELFRFGMQVIYGGTGDKAICDRR